MDELLDSRCIAAIVAIALIPSTIAGFVWVDLLEHQYALLNSSLPSLTAAVLGARTLLAVALVAAFAATFVPIGRPRASTGSVRLGQVAVVVVLAATLAAAVVVYFPVLALLTKVR